MSTSAVEVVGLIRSFGERRALDGVTFEVARGEVFGVLGPNGGGKSTLFKILATLLPAGGGEARILGQDVVREAAAVRRSIGVVFQSPSLDPKLTVRENLLHQGHLYGLRGKFLRDRIVRLLEEFGLGERRGERVETLSGGLARRVEIAKSLLHEPSVLLLDEPSTGLDPRARRDLSLLLKGLAESSGTTVLLTTHILDEADASDRVIILDRGRLVAQGAPDGLKTQIEGGVITLEAGEAELLALEVGREFEIEGRLVGGALRFEVSDPHTWAKRIGERFGDRIDLLTVARPSLEDVFLARTGHAFEESTLRPKELQR